MAKYPGSIEEIIKHFPLADTHNLEPEISSVLRSVNYCLIPTYHKYGLCF